MNEKRRPSFVHLPQVRLCHGRGKREREREREGSYKYKEKCSFVTIFVFLSLSFLTLTHIRSRDEKGLKSLVFSARNDEEGGGNKGERSRNRIIVQVPEILVRTDTGCGENNDTFVQVLIAHQRYPRSLSLIQRLNSHYLCKVWQLPLPNKFVKVGYKMLMNLWPS